MHDVIGSILVAIFNRHYAVKTAVEIEPGLVTVKLLGVHNDIKVVSCKHTFTAQEAPDLDGKELTLVYPTEAVLNSPLINRNIQIGTHLLDCEESELVQEVINLLRLTQNYINASVAINQVNSLRILTPPLDKIPGVLQFRSIREEYEDLEKEISIFRHDFKWIDELVAKLRRLDKTVNIFALLGKLPTPPKVETTEEQID